MGREQKPPGPTWSSPRRIKELSPEPGPSIPELCGPSTGSTLCRTRDREGDLQMVPKVGNVQPPTPQEFPFFPCPLCSSVGTLVQVLGPVVVLQRPLIYDLLVHPPCHHHFPEKSLQKKPGNSAPTPSALSAAPRLNNQT